MPQLFKSKVTAHEDFIITAMKKTVRMVSKSGNYTDLQKAQKYSVAIKPVLEIEKDVILKSEDKTNKINSYIKESIWPAI